MFTCSYDAKKLMRQLSQVLRMLNTSTKQSQVAAQVSTAPACLKAEASPACCMCSCNFNRFKSCQKYSQTKMSSRSSRNPIQVPPKIP